MNRLRNPRPHMGFACIGGNAACCFCHCNRILQFPNATGRHNKNGSGALRLQKSKVGGAAASVQSECDIHRPPVIFDEAAHTGHISQARGVCALLQQPQRLGVHVHCNEGDCGEELQGVGVNVAGECAGKHGAAYGAENKHHVAAATAEIDHSERLALTRKLQRLQHGIIHSNICSAGAAMCSRTSTTACNTTAKLSTCSRLRSVRWAARASR